MYSFLTRGFKRNIQYVYCVDVSSDPRKEVEQRGRSVNLALSVRGIESLRAVGAEGPVNITTTLKDNLLMPIFTSKLPQLMLKPTTFLLYMPCAIAYN